MTVFERHARSVAGAEAQAHVQILGRPLAHGDDGDLLLRVNFGVLERHGDVREDAEGGEPLLGCPHETAAIEASLDERDAGEDEPLVRPSRASNDDVLDPHLVALVDDESRAGPRVIRRELDTLFDVREGEPPLGVLVEQPSARSVEFDLRHWLAQAEIRDARQIGLHEHAVALERGVPQDRARANLHGDLEHDARLAADPVARIGDTRRRRRLVRDGQVRVALRTLNERSNELAYGHAFAGGRVSIALAAKERHGPHRRGQISLGAIELLQMSRGPVVDVLDVGPPRIGFQRCDARPRQVARPEHRVHDSWIHRTDDARPGQRLGEEAIDLLVHPTRLALSREARIFAPDDGDDLVLSYVEHEDVLRVARRAAELRRDPDVQEPAVHVILFDAGRERAGGSVLVVSEIECVRELALVEAVIALELYLDLGPGADVDEEHRGSPRSLQAMRDGCGLPAIVSQRVLKVSVCARERIAVRAVAGRNRVVVDERGEAP